MAAEPNLTTPDAGDLNASARRICAERGWAMSDGSYPIRPLDNHGRTDLGKAIGAVGRGGGSHDAIRRHIIKRARALRLSDMIPDNWSSSGGMGERSDCSDQPKAPILHRAAVEVAEVKQAQRIITLVAVPYDQETMVKFRGEMWNESFAPGSFDGIEKRPNRVRVNRDHNRSRTVGKAVNFMPSRQEGLVSDLRIAQTPLGDETLALADEDMLSGSVGYGALPRNVDSDRRNMTRRVKTAYLDHIAMVENPAYEGAQVLDVRDEHELPVPASRLVTPDLDEFTTDEILRWAAERLNKQ